VTAPPRPVDRTGDVLQAWLQQWRERAAAAQRTGNGHAHGQGHGYGRGHGKKSRD
jgi:hypothetical protein